MRFITGGRATPRTEIETALAGWSDRRWAGLERKTGNWLGWFRCARQPMANASSATG